MLVYAPLDALHAQMQLLVLYAQLAIILTQQHVQLAHLHAVPVQPQQYLVTVA
jgi:hypothetical protein